MQQLAKCLRDESGATAVECGLIAGAIAASVIFASRLFGDDLAEFLFAASHGF
jgi:Flp pilus assembly pilin Flp